MTLLVGGLKFDVELMALPDNTGSCGEQHPNGYECAYRSGHNGWHADYHRGETRAIWHDYSFGGGPILTSIQPLTINGINTNAAVFYNDGSVFDNYSWWRGGCGARLPWWGGQFVNCNTHAVKGYCCHVGKRNRLYTLQKQ